MLLAYRVPGVTLLVYRLQSPELAGKRIELLTEIVPKLARVAFLAYRPDPAHRLFIKEAQEAAEALKIQIQSLVVENPEEIEGAFSKMVRERAGALVIQPLFIGGLGQSKKILELAGKNRLPDNLGRHPICRTRRVNLLRGKSHGIGPTRCRVG